MSESPFIADDVKSHVDFFLNKQFPNMGQLVDMQFTHFSKDKVIATMPVDHRTHQPFGLLHGGASVMLAESVASIGAWLNVDLDKQYAVGVEINANHIKAVRTGSVKATATPLHRGRSLHVWSIEIQNEKNQLVCSSRCTLAIQNRR